MFIYNLKINSKLLFKFLLILCFLIAIIILIYVLSIFINKTQKANTISTNSANTVTVEDTIPTKDINNIQSTNYTNVLKATHDNIDNYVGLKINFTGYVYKVYGFNNNQFVLARNMIISSDLQYVVVGFLCEHPNALDYPTNTWINVTGTITRGTYNNKEIPIINVTEITKVDEPKDALVYPPDNYYIPTINMF